MRDAEVVLGILRDRGRRGLPVEDLYRQLFNPSLFLMAWAKLYANKGSMTPGVDGETADGMSMARIEAIIEAIRYERYQFAAVKRVWIPKKKGGRRPLGVPSWSDKLVGEVVRLLLEAYYEPQFSDRSHGFRPDRGCHTALSEIATTWTGATWFIEADISDCFGSIDHDVLLSILAERINDGRFIELIRRMLRAGYMEDWDWHPTISGTPQGGVVSPILANIYLDKLDKHVETMLIPRYTRGINRAKNREYQETTYELGKARQSGDQERVAGLERQRQQMPSGDPKDPEYRRLRYCRYADDQLFGFTGPKKEAEQVKREVATFLRDVLKLELSQAKTLVTHARTGKARFLGYDISIGHEEKGRRGGRRKRSLNGMVLLSVPLTVIAAQAAPYLKGGKPRAQRHLHQRSDYEIVAWYGTVYRGVVNFYKLAGNIYRLGKLRWVMETSMLKTLAGKHHMSVTAVARKHKQRVVTSDGPRVCFEAQLEREGRPPLTARFGEVQLTCNKHAVLVEPSPYPSRRIGVELVGRVAKRICELCGRKGVRVQAHQVKGLAVLDPAGFSWQRIMAKRHRKTLMVCSDCHVLIHQHEPVTSPQLESRVP